MKLSPTLVLLSAGALVGAPPIARAQDALPPATALPELVPLPETPPPPATETRLRTIVIRNVPSAIIAYQLDPAHNPPPPGFVPAQLQREGNAITPALDAFAGIGRLDLLAQWIQLDAATLDQELPSWKDLSAIGNARVLTPAEKQTLDKLNASGQIAPVTQRVFAFDKRPAFLSYLPFRPVIQSQIAPSLREVPRDILPQPRPDSLFANPPYIPNIAETAPMLEQMAPMPNGGNRALQPDAPPPELPPDTLILPPKSGTTPGANPYLRSAPGDLGDMLGFKFQLTPTLTDGKNMVVQLRGFEQSPDKPNYVAGVELAEGQSAVFSLPQLVLSRGGQTRRIFLLVTPRRVPEVAPVSPSQTPVVPAP